MAQRLTITMVGGKFLVVSDFGKDTTAFDVHHTITTNPAVWNTINYPDGTKVTIKTDNIATMELVNI